MSETPPAAGVALDALSPVDGRYAAQTERLRPLLSEFGLMRARFRVEVGWLQALLGIPAIAATGPDAGTVRARLPRLADAFTRADAVRIKELESVTRHDVKAVEYFLRERLAEDPALAPFAELAHFACTSEDINNVAYALTVRNARDRVLLPELEELLGRLRDLAHRHAETPMLARTHGQPATPTTLGKEIAVFVDRLARQRARLGAVRLRAKFNGATGNYNAHRAAYPEVNWPAVAQRFISDLDLEFNAYTTQIEPHDDLAELFHALVRVNDVVLDLCRDLWGYISLGYFRQRVAAGEVGSSTMPHKVNPIDFENAEGNVGIANALLEHLAGKLPVSRWQRDLSDSTVLRNIGVACAHALLAWKSCLRGLARLEVCEERLRADLESAWEVLAEPIQTVMRRAGIEGGYEALKEFTRGQSIDREALHRFIGGLALKEADRERLLALTPWTYTGEAGRLAREI